MPTDIGTKHTEEELKHIFKEVMGAWIEAVHAGLPPTQERRIVMVIEELMKKERLWFQFPCELLYADDLVVNDESEKEATMTFQKWKSAIEKQGLCIEINKMKVMVSGEEEREEKWTIVLFNMQKMELEGIKFNVGSILDGVTRGAVV